MPDAGPSAPAKSKGAVKAVKSGADTGSDGKKRFEVKKWNAVALWAWDIVVDNCAICRNHIMDLCECLLQCVQRIAYRCVKVSNVRPTKLQLRAKNAQLHGESAITPFIFTASHAG